MIVVSCCLVISVDVLFSALYLGFFLETVCIELLSISDGLGRVWLPKCWQPDKKLPHGRPAVHSPRGGTPPFGECTERCLPCGIFLVGCQHVGAEHVQAYHF